MGHVIPLVTVMSAHFLDRGRAAIVVHSLVLQHVRHRRQIRLARDRDLVRVRTLRQRMQIEPAFCLVASSSCFQSVFTATSF